MNSVWSFCCVSAAFRHGQKPPQIVDLQITQDEAVAKFESHQRQQLKFLQASGLLKDEKTASVRAALLPFWMFDITISSEAKATMGHLTDRSAHDACMHAACTPADAARGASGWLISMTEDHPSLGGITAAVRCGC